MEDQDQYDEEKQKAVDAAKEKADEAKAFMASRIEGMAEECVRKNVSIVEAEAEDKAMIVTKDMRRLIHDCGRACYLAGVSAMSMNLINNAQSNLECIDLVQRRQQKIREALKKNG